MMKQSVKPLKNYNHYLMNLHECHDKTLEALGTKGPEPGCGVFFADKDPHHGEKGK